MIALTAGRNTVDPLEPNEAFLHRPGGPPLPFRQDGNMACTDSLAATVPKVYLAPSIIGLVVEELAPDVRPAEGELHCARLPLLLLPGHALNPA
jgi:hypothetical protein